MLNRESIFLGKWFEFCELNAGDFSMKNWFHTKLRFIFIWVNIFFFVKVLMFDVVPAITVQMEFFVHISTQLCCVNENFQHFFRFKHLAIFVLMFIMCAPWLSPNGEINDKWKWHLFKSIDWYSKASSCLLLFQSKSVHIQCMVHWPYATVTAEQKKKRTICDVKAHVHCNRYNSSKNEENWENICV